MADNFISLLLEFTKDFESPTSFWRWSGYGAVSATLRFNCYINWGSSNLYPNTFILLLADSAAYRKDAGPELVGELLKEHGHTKVITGRVTWPGVIDELSQDIGNKKTGVPIKDGGGVLIAKEFTAMFIQDPSLVKNMTEAYGYEEEFQDVLRGGKCKIKKRCLSILGGSNETLLRNVFSNEAVYGGLLRRYYLVKPDKKRPPNCLIDDTAQKITLPVAERKILVDQLRQISQLKGMFSLTPDAKIAYKEWYEDLYNNYDKFDDKTGFIQGVHALIIKIAMILAGSENSLVISEANITTAIKEVMVLKENYVTYIMGAGKNPHADMGATILGQLWLLHLSNNGHIQSWKRRDILLKYWNEISSEDLDKLLTTLESAQLISMIPSGSEPGYILTQKAQEIFLKNVKSASNSTN